MHKSIVVMKNISVGLIIAGTLARPACAEVKKVKANPPPKHQVVSLKGSEKQPAKKAISTLPKPGLTDAQKSAASTALKSLRKLGAATEIGVSAPDYQNRLIDAKADVNEALRNLPDGKLKINIDDAMQAYVDASTFWNESLQGKSRQGILKGASGPILAKYKLTLLETGKTERDAMDKADAEFKQVDIEYKNLKDTDDGYEKRQDELLAKEGKLIQESTDDLAASIEINDKDRKNLLTAIWNVASQKTKDAESALK